MSGPRRRRDALVCKCLLVGQRQIEAAIRGGARTRAQIGERCEAGTGCTGCHDALDILLDEHDTRRARAAARKNERVPQLPLFGGRILPSRDGEVGVGDEDT
ncbi:MAG: (2Fe-2S)-binding protein [Nannocystaceae bacterium]|nr:(2Fe-2S)-binding protein [Nannocystaceae bacterium]